MWNKLIISWNISKLLNSCETLEQIPQGESKKAYDTLVKMGAKVLPALKDKNAQLINEHLLYSEWLKSGSSPNPYENYALKSNAEKRYRYVIEVKQARIVDVMEEIEGIRGSE